MRSGRENVFFIHVTWLPYIGATGELKTKPTQHSVAALRSIGISPNMIIARSDHPIEDGSDDKIALFCDVEKEAVIPMVTATVLYEVPLLLEKAGVGGFTSSKSLSIKPTRSPDMKPWKKLVDSVSKPKPDGEDRPGRQIRGTAGCLHVGARGAQACRPGSSASMWRSAGCTPPTSKKTRAGMSCRAPDGIMVPGGFGSRGIEGKIMAARYAREKKMPYLGLCLGMQVMCIEFARTVLDHEDANSTEFDRGTDDPVIDLMIDQRSITDMGGTMRLGLYPCVLKKGTKAAAAYGVSQVEERHRHRFEFNNAYRE